MKKHFLIWVFILWGLFPSVMVYAQGWPAQQQYTVPKCTGISPGSVNNEDCIEPKEDKKNCETLANSSSKTTLCSQRYSCESLFESNPDTANACNFARCENDRWIWSKYCDCKYKQKWIPLNTSIPFIGNCITKTSNDGSAATNAFPTIIGAATRILVTVIMLVSFVMVVIGGIQWASGNASDGKKMITKVATWFILLGLMWAILRLINPNFFK